MDWEGVCGLRFIDWEGCSVFGLRFLFYRQP